LRPIVGPFKQPEKGKSWCEPLPDPIGGEAVAAAVRLEPGAGVTGEDLRVWCRERLRREAVPEHWYIVEELPRSARGKISRDAVRRLLGKEP
jgi:acyl-coenzyme A synthetase/AMP-(fatty) acid ligase